MKTAAPLITPAARHALRDRPHIDPLLYRLAVALEYGLIALAIALLGSLA